MTECKEGDLVPVSVLCSRIEIDLILDVVISVYDNFLCLLALLNITPEKSGGISRGQHKLKNEYRT